MIDEFREESVEALHRSASAKALTTPWVNWGPSIPGDATPCFKGGFLFRIIDSEKRLWALYNDTFVYEMHATFIFGPGSDMQPLGALSSSGGEADADNRVVAVSQGNELTISLIVYPMETVEFARGDKSKYRCHFDGKPLSKEYIQRESVLAYAEVDKDRAALAKYACSLTDPEAVLKVCKAHRVAFVDPSFPPEQISLDSGRKLITPSGWRRPEAYLPTHLRSQIRLFRRAVTPSATQRGELGNSWVMSAMAAIAEHPDHIKDMFRHPRRPEETARDEAVGAYRVWLNKDGLWQSVLIDSFLPVVGKQQRYARSADDPCEMWVSYLEKAYAKRNRCYSSIAGGDPLFAVRDFTGFPTSRLDLRFRECVTDPVKSYVFFQRMVQDYENGHVVLLSTPGNSDPRSGHNSYKEKGIFVGYAYAVLSARFIELRTPKRRKVPPLRLLRLRNAWDAATKWNGRWSAQSPAWAEHPEACAAFPNHDGEDGTFIMEWSEVLETFVGCGVVFNHFGYADYRIPFEFSGAIPNLCLEIHVTEPTSLTLILSQADTKGTPKEAEDYAPIMISIAGAMPSTTTPLSQDGSTRSSGNSAPSITAGNFPVVAREYSLLVNSSADAETPSKSFTFLQGRDISATYTFVPEQSPYLVVPRLLVQQPANGTSTSSGGSKASPTVANGVEPCTCVLGILSQLAFTPYGQAHVRLRRLPAKNSVFENYLSFENDSEEVEKTFYEKRAGSSVVTRKASELN
ncbi:putative calpain-like cysteine peptidase putativecysteine peptidase Clan CA family C2 [Leptomonas pyrrhocoris]|uniref:Putative calpain-like cysteine peptidase putativecysteine peptidase Clan CA family C2 n=1 Tax=Leptomonas pyrrhocoris TaxID=157538 RepID=A0A0M9FST1_LEPPY|nr:putative calpain-like cysteine peptidase putativecysteine peptidase Clan CA family C2 [Leptomonas pyrrhocoris]KPA75257.1 putative calpain-like cysteine peptidase putativecysteine peptidase Clan CA family C2 [Leptomonas pyrrhocoris]|eukprot:XP_015653696.1 putative calpain-like cysteine peptidase putativecysteine peptidase Clan CA family C2 [Leptomonas pyrrhocoris]